MPLTATRVHSINAPDFLQDLDLTHDELVSLLELAADVKNHPTHYANSLAGKSIALLFEKPSLRTRVTFELAIRQMDGTSIALDGPIGEREPLKDVARNLDRWVNAIVARTFSHNTIEELSQWASVPVVNALTDLYHPCQALADMQTLQEHFGTLRGLKFAFIGDGNNVAHSLMLNAARLGMNYVHATPPGYLPHPEVLAQAEGLAAASGGSVNITHDPCEAADSAHAIYTDVWASMGQEKEAALRRLRFAPYQVNEELFALAQPDAKFMHCLPAKRGEEVTDDVIESPRSIVFDQAENRLHAQKALLLMLLA